MTVLFWNSLEPIKYSKKDFRVTIDVSVIVENDACIPAILKKINFETVDTDHPSGDISSISFVKAEPLCEHEIPMGEICKVCEKIMVEQETKTRKKHSKLLQKID